MFRVETAEGAKGHDTVLVVLAVIRVLVYQRTATVALKMYRLL